MQEAGAIFRPYVAGIFSDQSLTPEERAKWEKEWRERWKEEHIDDIKHNGDFWRVKHKWARTKEEALVMMKEHVEYFMRYIKDIRSAEIRRCADAYER